MATGTSPEDRFRERYGPWDIVTGASDGIGLEAVAASLRSSTVTCATNLTCCSSITHRSPLSPGILVNVWQAGAGRPDSSHFNSRFSGCARSRQLCGQQGSRANACRRTLSRMVLIRGGCAVGGARPGRRTTTRPGLLAKILGHSLALTPRAIRTAIMGKVMAGMTRQLP